MLIYPFIAIKLVKSLSRLWVPSLLSGSKVDALEVDVEIAVGHLPLDLGLAPLDLPAVVDHELLQVAQLGEPFQGSDKGLPGQSQLLER